MVTPVTQWDVGKSELLCTLRLGVMANTPVKLGAEWRKKKTLIEFKDEDEEPAVHYSNDFEVQF